MVQLQAAVSKLMKAKVRPSRPDVALMSANALMRRSCDHVLHVTS